MRKGNGVFKNVYIKLMTLYLVVVMLFYILWSVMYTMERRSTYQDALRFYDYKTESFINLIEDDIVRLKQGINSLIMQKDVMRFAFNYENISTYEYYEVHRTIKDLMSTLHFSSNIISDIIMYFRESDTIFSIDSTPARAKAIIKQLENNPDITSNSAICRIGDDLAIVSSYTYDGMYSPYGSAYSVIMLVNQNRMITQFNQYADHRTQFFISDLDGNILIYPEYNNDGPEQQLSRLDISIKEQKEYVNLGGTRYRLINKTSDLLKVKLWLMLDDKQISIGNSGIEGYLFFFMILGVIISGAYFVLSQRLVKEPLKALTDAFGEIEKGNLSIRLSRKQNDDMAYVYQQFNAMVSKTQNLIEKEYRYQIITQKLTLKYLQALINPHFLYNCFFMMVNMLETQNYDELKLFMKYMGQYFKFMHRSGEGITQLCNEVQHAQIYAKIQSMRFPHRVKIHIEQVPAAYGNLMVPSLILQPLLENAFEHGFKNKKENCILNVSFEETDEQIKIHVCDNGQGISDEIMELIDKQMKDPDFLAPTDFAIVNIHRRLLLNYGEDCGLEMRRSDLGGLEVIVSINKKMTKHNDVEHKEH